MLFTPSTSPSGVSATEGNSNISTYASTTPTVGISLPTSISFDDVLPTTTGATTTASTNLTVTTNDSAGYSLYLYADEDNSLKPINSANNSSISATSTASTLNDLVNNTWGYSIGTTTAGPNTLYAAVPTDGSTPIQTKDTSTTNSANDTYTLTLGAKVNTDLPSGTYSNTLTLAVVAEPKAITSLQDLTLTECQAKASDSNLTVIDSRDNNDYTVRYINGACWMTQNLRLSSTTEDGSSRILTPEDSNVARDWTFPTASLTSGNSYTGARSAISNDPEHALEYGGYYNYCAASAGTVCNNTTAEDATDSICPKGWELPTRDEMNSITSYTSAFSPVLSGYYVNGSLGNTGFYGNWWSATAYDSGNQYSLYYNRGSLFVGSSTKFGGFSVRCINPGSLTINFNGNGATGGSMTSQQIPVGNTAPLNSNSFTRTGYMFTGWNTEANGSGTSYTDGADYTVTTTGDTTITLYAQWKQVISMQDFTLANCQSQASNNNITVTDLRDSNDYTVRYINGACWMTQNLRLPGGTKLTSADSNVAQDYTLPSSSTSGFNSYTVANMYNGTDTTYGAYYNFCAASAGTVCSQTQQDATQDICPKGWRLPTHDEQAGITSYTSAFSPVYSGYYYNGSLYNTGYFGRWWSATASNGNDQYYLFYFNGSLDTSGVNKYYGHSVRCIRDN